MCGLAGILLAEPVPAPELRARLRGMIATLRHRGPDDEGVWSDDDAGLGHARLAVLDLTSAGHQPMSDPDARVWLVFNGEIYNFKALREELQQKGHRFRSQTDSEVILCGYRQWGADVVPRLRGMFAFAIWDRDAKRLLLARDRIGKKPLFYSRTRAGFLFASEIKALLAWPRVDRSPDLATLHQYLSFRYVPSPRTAFSGILAVPPAHVLTVDVGADGRHTSTLQRYWSLPDPARAIDRIPDAALCEELIGRLKDSVRLRLTADVPIGVFLSGGVDSSAVVAMMAELGAGRVKTFSIGFEDAAYDETAYARIVAQRYGTDHHELVVKADGGRVLPLLAWHYDQPFADPAAVPTFHLAELARRHVTVALNGDGGDECFLGYTVYALMRRLERFDRVPPWMCRLAGAAVAQIPVPRRFARRRRHAALVLRGRTLRPADRYAWSSVQFDEEVKRDAYGPALRPFLGPSAADLWQPHFDRAPGLVNGANSADLHMYLPDDLMVKVDIATMAHGLEGRSPLLDHELVEWATALSVRTLMAGGVTKALFKKAMARYVPAEVLARPKMGFGCPVDRWLRTDLKEIAGDLLVSRTSAARGFFALGFVQNLFDAHCRGDADHHAKLWALLMLELWCRTWIDTNSSDVTPVCRPALSAAPQSAGHRVPQAG